MKLSILFTLILLCFPAFSKGIVIIAHPQCPISTLTRDQVRDFYLKKVRQWPDRTNVRFFDRSETSPAREIFIREFLQRTPRQVDRFWIEQKFKSGDSAPSAVENDLILQDLISRFPGAISYLPDAVPITKNLKVIQVTGAE